jgi:predicted acetyltransferase
MSLTMRWTGRDEIPLVAQTRWMCYGHAAKDLPMFLERAGGNTWAKDGDFLLAERDGMAVGTATSLSMRMWVRGAALSCQGVAWVGAIKTARRRGGGEVPGVASAVMRETLRVGRERGCVVSALMPFRASYYEHFGYGLVERRSEWTIPLPILPSGPCDGWRFMKPEDRPALAAAWQRAVEAGQCDIERDMPCWNSRPKFEEEGMVMINRPDPAGPVRAYALLMHQSVPPRNLLRVAEWCADDPASFQSLLCFLGTLRDQYSSVMVIAPADWQLNRLLRETQITHRPVEHQTAEVRTHTRMQLRILDHRKYLQSLHLPARAAGKLSVAIHETEGDTVRLRLELAEGRIEVTAGPAAAADFECSDRQWAAIATGDLSATAAVQNGLAVQNTAGASQILDILSAGPLPFCQESF